MFPLSGDILLRPYTKDRTSNHVDGNDDINENRIMAMLMMAMVIYKEHDYIADY